MLGVFETISYIFLVVLAGTAAARFRLLSPQAGTVLTEFAVAIAVPLLLFRTILDASFEGLAPLPLWMSYVSAAGCAWVAGCLVTRAFGRDWQSCVVGGMAAGFANLVQLGVPLIQGLYGQPGLDVLTLLVAIQLPVVTGVSILAFEMLRPRELRNSNARSPFAAVITSLFLNPLMIGITAGFAVRFTGIPLPDLMVRVVDAFAGVAGPIALFSIGFSLFGFGVAGNVRPALALSAVKLVVMPAVALGLCLLIGVPSSGALVVVAAASLATGINPYLVASRFGLGQALASNTMTISTILAFAAVWFWISVASYMLGQ